MLERGREFFSLRPVGELGRKFLWRIEFTVGVKGTTLAPSLSILAKLLKIVPIHSLAASAQGLEHDLHYSKRLRASARNRKRTVESHFLRLVFRKGGKRVLGSGTFFLTRDYDHLGGGLVEVADVNEGILLIRKSRSAPMNLLTPDQVAERTGIAVGTLAQWRSQKRGIPFVKIAHNMVRYRLEDVEAFVAKHLVTVEDIRRN